MDQRLLCVASMVREGAALADIGMSMEELAALAKNSVDASFASDSRKTQLTKELLAWRAQHGI